MSDCCSGLHSFVPAHATKLIFESMGSKSTQTEFSPDISMENDMSVKGQIKEAAGFVKEEMNEHGKSPESKAKAQEGRNLRNEGRVEDGKAPKTTSPGSGHPEK
jgi:hypothetical protein